MKRLLAILTALVVCVACADPAIPLPTPTITASPTPEPTPSPTPEPRRLGVCLSEEPDTLYVHATDSDSAHHVWEAIYDGPIDNQRYEFHPVIFAELPSLDRGTAAVRTVSVQAGDQVVTSAGHVLSLAPGVLVDDAAGDRVAFDGAPIPMPRMVVTFTLRPDLQWADGARLTAHDSVYSFEIAADPATPTDKHVIERTADYRALDEETLVWEGVPGFIDPGYALNFWHPLPRHDLQGISPTELLSAERSTKEPLGWGPFTIRDWVPGQRLEVERNPFYFRASEGLPRLDEVVFYFVDSPNELLEKLTAGICDIVTHDSAAAVLDVVEEDGLPPSVTSLATHDAAWELLAFGINPAGGYERPDYLDDVRVRRGIAQCIDREAVASVASPAGDRVLHSYLPPEHPLYADGKLTIWEYDPDAGETQLGQAGWRDLDGDGVRQAEGIPGIAQGTPFRITLHTTDDPSRLGAAQVIATNLGTCGIEVTVEVLPADEFFAPGPEGVLFGRRFDLAQFSWRVTNVPLCDLFLSSQMPTARNWSRPNVGGFISAEYDDACRRALQALPDSLEYVDEHKEAQRIFSERLPVLPLFGRQRITLVSTNVTGLIPAASERSELWNLEQISVQR